MASFLSKQVPAGAWDTHHHIFEPEKFPLAPGRHFTPSTATLERLKAFEDSLGIEHVCIAHGLAYGPDCSSLLHYLSEFHGRARGICVLDVDLVTDAVLERYHGAGVRSVRLDFFKHRCIDDLEGQIKLIEATAGRLESWSNRENRSKWSIQIQQPHVEYWSRIREFASKLSVPLVVDHMGLLPGASMKGNGDSTDATESYGFAALCGALADGNLWIKISAPYRCSYQDFEYQDLEGLVRKLVEANPDRVVWGSDWPHTQRHGDRVGKNKEDTEPFLNINDATWVKSLSTWLSEEEWHKMWVDNPRKLYDYQLS